MKIDRDMTFMVLRDKDRILFGTKKCGFGKGKIVGIGGKVDAGETVEEAAVRETEEEIGVKVTEFQKLGEIVFDNLSYKDSHECNKMHIFVATKWEGEPIETDEIEPIWIPTREIPYERFWEDNQYWMPYVLIGDFVQGYFLFDDQNRVKSHWVEPVSNFVIDEFIDSQFKLPALDDVSNFNARYAARAVLIDDQKRVALLNAKNRGYYKLPGGGIDDGELVREALEREAIEETGYKIEIIENLGKTVEHRCKWEQDNISYAYLCRAKDFVGANLMEDEIEDGFTLEWFDDIDSAIEALESIDTSDMIYQAKFFTARELSILIAARPIIRSIDG